MGGAYLSTITTSKTHTFDAVSLTDCSSESVRMAALSLLLRSMGARVRFSWEKCPYKEFHRRLRQKRSHDRKNSQNLYEPGSEILPQKLLCYTSKLCFWNFVPCFAEKRIQLFNSVNNSECMKQHCTSPFNGLFITVPIWWNELAQLSPSSWILTLFRTAKNHICVIFSSHL